MRGNDPVEKSPTMNNTRNCLLCGHPVRGRSDKKFCNDYCRNGYNNARSARDQVLVRQVNGVLQRNRRILAALLSEAPTARVLREELLLRGFQFHYATHSLKRQGQVYRCCYEFGWTELPEERLRLLRLR